MSVSLNVSEDKDRTKNLALTTMPKQRSRDPFVWMIVMILLFSPEFVMVRYVLNAGEGLSILALCTVRLIGASGVMLLARCGTQIQPTMREFMMTIPHGFLQHLTPMIAFSIVLHHTNALTASFAFCTLPFMTAVLAHLCDISNDRMNRRSMLAAVFGVVAAVIARLEWWATISLDSEPSMMLIGALSYAMAIVYNRHVLKNIRPLSVAMSGIYFATALMVTLTMVVDKGALLTVTEASWRVLLCVAVLSILSTSNFILIFTHTENMVRPSYVSFFSYGVPLACLLVVTVVLPSTHAVTLPEVAVACGLAILLALMRRTITLARETPFYWTQES